MAQSHEMGKKGEEMALEHLQKHGYFIKATNWRFGKDEIDIIAKKEEVLVFVEVKTRGTDFFGDPAGFLSKGQQNRIIRAADAYIKENEWDDEARFDVIGIVAAKSGWKMRHIEDAFFPTT